MIINILIRKPLLSFISIGIALLLCDTVFAARRLCVNTEGSAVRKDFGTKGLKIFEAKKYTPLKRIDSWRPKGGKKTLWYKIKDMDNEVGWIYHKLVDRNYRCGMVKVEKESIKLKRSWKTRKIERIYLPKYTTFKVIAFRKGWVLAETVKKDKFWMPISVAWIP